MNLPEQTLADLLAFWPVARLATTSAGAQPHIVPIVFCEFHGAIYSPLDGKRKSGAHLKRTNNIAHNPKATMLLDHFASDWQELWWVRIDGHADLFEPSATDARTIAQQLIHKYPQYRDPTLMFNRSVYLRLQPAKVTAWAQSNSPSAIHSAISTQ